VLMWLWCKILWCLCHAFTIFQCVHSICRPCPR
jgi:hypothetical protein